MRKQFRKYESPFKSFLWSALHFPITSHNSLLVCFLWVFSPPPANRLQHLHPRHRMPAETWPRIWRWWVAAAWPSSSGPTPPPPSSPAHLPPLLSRPPSHTATPPHPREGVGKIKASTQQFQSKPQSYISLKISQLLNTTSNIQKVYVTLNYVNQLWVRTVWEVWLFLTNIFQNIKLPHWWWTTANIQALNCHSNVCIVSF